MASSTEEISYQILSEAQLEMINQLCAFKDMVRTREPFTWEHIRVIARELYLTYLRVEEATEVFLPPDIQHVRSEIKIKLKAMVAEHT